MNFKCGHPRDEENALVYNAGRKTGVNVRCRICYNALRKAYQRKRKRKAQGLTTNISLNRRP